MCDKILVYSTIIFSALKKALNNGRRSLVGNEAAWDASGPEIDPHVGHILFVKIWL